LICWIGDNLTKCETIEYTPGTETPGEIGSPDLVESILSKKRNSLYVFAHNEKVASITIYSMLADTAKKYTDQNIIIKVVDKASRISLDLKHRSCRQKQQY
jgi:hypothetical protein